jgi:Lrp/AsnC family leucine-responsive transcriptional regulator
MDKIDYMILECIKKNARMQWKDIGKKVHLSGQAVAFRVRKMEDNGIIQGYSAVTNERALGNIIAFITVFMESADHHTFHTFVRAKKEIVECHRISGDGCYLLKTVIKDHDALTHLLDQILHYGNYRVSLSLDTIVTSGALGNWQP